MQFEIWGMQWFPKERGLPPQEALVYTVNRTWNAPPLLVTSAPHHLPSKRLGKKSLEPLQRCLESHPPACTKITLSRVVSEEHTRST